MEQLSNRLRFRPSPQSRARQRGVVVFISLIVLVVMTLAALGLVRSIDTATLISGNMAFKQASLQLADIGTEAAVNELERFSGTSADAAYPGGCAGNGSCRYYPVIQPLDSRGVPTAINWANVSQTSGITFPSTFNGNSIIPTGYEIKYVVERLCTGTLPITDLASNCYATSTDDSGGGSKKSNAPVYTSVANIFYRATIRVSNPKGAETITQVVLKR